jgi:phosphatidylserine decarboxylase
VKIAAEGYPFLIAAAIVCVLAFFLGWWFVGVLAAACAAFFLLFFRDPERHPPDGEDLVVAPADGRVVSVVRTEFAPLIDGPAVRVSIFMSPLDVHINRMPATVTVAEVRHTRGKFLAAYKDHAAEQNEQNALRLTARGGKRLALVQVAGFLARRVVCRARPGDTYRKGERFGLIMFGSRTDLYLPGDAEIRVAERDKVKGGESILGRLL